MLRITIGTLILGAGALTLSAQTAPPQPFAWPQTPAVLPKQERALRELVKMNVTRNPATVCSIRLIEVPVAKDIDPGIFTPKPGPAPENIDQTWATPSTPAIQLPAPPCQETKR